MKKNNQAKIIYGLFFVAALLFFAAPNPDAERGIYKVSGGSLVFASNNSSKGIYIPTSSEIGLSDKPVKDIVMNFLKWLLTIFGALAIISFVIAGILYLTSVGDKEKAQKAQKAMEASIIGVIVAISALVIIYAVDKALRASSGF